MGETFAYLNTLRELVEGIIARDAFHLHPICLGQLVSWVGNIVLKLSGIGK
jgi:hypothetical protein